MIEARRRDIAVVDKVKKETMIIDLSNNRRYRSM